MSMGLVVLIVWLLNITENHSVNIHKNSNILFTQKSKTAAYAEA